MSATPSPNPLSPTLEKVLQKLEDRDFGGRLRRIYMAASQAVANLADLDLLKYETTSVDEPADLSLWEEVAPIIARTVVDVNDLLNVIRTELNPAPPESEIGGLLSEAVDDASRESDPESHRRSHEAVESIKTAADSLADQVTALGHRVRSPEIVSDRWNLIAEVQFFRSRFRDEIGKVVFDSASVFEELHPHDVIPGYAEELRAAITVRTTVTDLSRVISSRAEKIRTAEPEDLQFEAQQLLGEMDLFGKTPGYKALRAHDKKQVLQYRVKMGKMSLNPVPSHEELLEVVEPFAALVASLKQVNQREILQTHDRELWASCGVKLEQSERLLDGDPEQAARAIASAVALAQGLYGRSAELDHHLRKARKAQMPRDSVKLREELDRLRRLLSELSVS